MLFASRECWIVSELEPLAPIVGRVVAAIWLSRAFLQRLAEPLDRGGNPLAFPLSQRDPTNHLRAHVGPEPPRDP
jgi:hypothetical protein